MRSWINTTIERYTSVKKHQQPRQAPKNQTQITKLKCTAPSQQIEESSEIKQLAPKILEYEFRCEGKSVNSQDLSILISLYTKAVEHYSSIGSGKYKLFKRRMQLFLQKNTVDQFLRGQSVSLAQKKQQAIQEINRSKIKSIGEAHRLLEEADKSTVKNKHVLDTSITNQELSLRLRMKKRGTRSTFTIRTAAEYQEFDDNGGHEGWQLGRSNICLKSRQA